MFTYHCDPGHGWLEVPWTELKNLGLNPSDFSSCSYRKRNVFYLEEDCDASKFVKAYEARHGTKPKFREVHTNSSSFIRNLPSIHS